MLRHGVNTIRGFSHEVNPMHFRYTGDNIRGTLQRAPYETMRNKRCYIWSGDFKNRFNRKSKCGHILFQNKLAKSIALVKLEKLSVYGRYSKKMIEGATHRLKGGNGWV